MAPAAELLTATCACVEGPGKGTDGDHPSIFPSSLAKMKTAGPELIPSVTTKLVPPLKTTPVGKPGTSTGLCGVPSAARSEALLAWLSEIHHVPVARAA